MNTQLNVISASIARDALQKSADDKYVAVPNETARKLSKLDFNGGEMCRYCAFSAGHYCDSQRRQAAGFGQFQCVIKGVIYRPATDIDQGVKS